MKLSQINEARYSGGKIETKYALFHTTRGKYYQSSSHAVKQGFRLKESLASGITFFRTYEHAIEELKSLQDKLEQKIGQKKGGWSEVTNTAVRNKIQQYLSELDKFQVVTIEASL